MERGNGVFDEGWKRINGRKRVSRRGGGGGKR